MALNIKNDEVERLVNELARLSGETKTEVVRNALVARRSHFAADVKRRERVRSFVRYLADEVWPTLEPDRLGVALSKAERESILGYGPEGV